MYKIPSEIDYGIVRDLAYLDEYGRFEAKVLLHLTNADTRSPELEFIVSVDGRKGEPFEDLRMRLVLKAARLYRMFEANAAQPTPFTGEPLTPLAA